MALAKTNVTAYKTNFGEGNEEAFSVSTSVITFNSNNVVKNIVNKDEINVIFISSSSKIYVSTFGGEYLEIDLEFTVHDVIYSDSIKKFIAVGAGDNRIKIKSSQDAIAWEEENWGDFGVESFTSSSILGIMEVENTFLIAVSCRQGNSPAYFAVNVSFRENEYIHSEQIVLGSFSNVFKGNNRMIFDGGNTSGIQVITVGENSKNNTNKFPKTSADGYFINISKDKYQIPELYRAVNCIDYNLVATGTSAIELISAMKYEGYYYLFTATSMCRGKSWTDVMNKGIEEYVPYDGGTEIPFTSVAPLNGEIALLCNGYIVILNIGGESNPIVETMETLSAKAALRKAMSYADEKIAHLEERIAALENANSESQAE